MKKLLVLGVCALFIACGSPQKTAETTGPDPNTDTMSTHKVGVAAASPTAAGADSKTAGVAPATAGTEKAGDIAAKPGAPKTEPAKPAQESGNAAAIKKGEALYSNIALVDCKGCHQLKIKIVGPAYADIAKKYENTPANVNYLVGKIIKGGAGVWGEVPMAPHPNLSEEDAKALVQYVLSVK